ncbi:T9SS type A sorting domain-containing protein [Saccharicrinis sp. FJH54]|uniref:T9SS type A sorting domain-containing protein n=1 Tax=Saccharicrinis sp. FJH54 TaxID=3344665 RepID=UPI0035D4AC14
MKRLSIYFLVSCISSFMSSAQLIQWQKYIPTSSYEQDNIIIKKQPNGYMLFGTANSSDGIFNDNHGYKDIWVAFLNESGTILWSKCYGGSKKDELKSVIESNDNQFILAANTNSNDGDVVRKISNLDTWVFKINNKGEIQWSTVFGDSVENEVTSITQDMNNDFYVLGKTDYMNIYDIGTTDSTRIWITKLNEFGDSLTTVIQPFYNFEYFNDIITVDDSSLMYVGNNQKFPFDALLVKINTSCDTLWTKTLGASKSDFAYSIVQLNSSDLIINGCSDSDDIPNTVNNGGFDLWITKISKEGVIYWSKQFGGSAFDLATQAIELEDKNLVIIGESNSNDKDVQLNNGKFDVLIIMLTPDGKLITSKVFGNTESDRGISIVERDSSLIFSAISEEEYTGYYGHNIFWIVKLNKSVILSNETNIDYPISLYPIPATKTINVNINNIKTIEVYDLNGRLLNSFNENKIDISNIENGFYIVKIITTSNLIITRNIIVEK